ncbi:DinB family protein [Bacillus sp. JJ1609]|uniref:DinB family protein n=1 Tax=Bacillus sp. JJ1609 TaxID=3122977 RepID=UPI0030009FA4
MNLKELLFHDFLYTFNREDWYTPLSNALEGVTFTDAAWRPEGGKVNCIAETLGHILYFQERLLRVLTESLDQFQQASENDDTFRISPDWNEGEWNRLLSKVQDINLELASLIDNLTDEDMQKKYKNRTAAEMISGVTRHNAHHIGQIVMLRKLQGSWPASRKFTF